MLGLSAFAEQAFGATVAHGGVVVIVSGSGVAVSQGTPTYKNSVLMAVTGSLCGTVSSGTPTYTISGSVSPTGSAVTISTGASDVNVITWNVIDPDASQTWTNIDPL
jgi:hypothetical protein